MSGIADLYYDSGLTGIGIVQTPALRNVQSLVDRNLRDTGLDRHWVRPQAVESVGVIGAGMMGTAIAAVHLKGNLPVVITDTDRRVLDDALDRIAAELTDGLHNTRPRRLLDRFVRPTTNAAVAAQCGLVIESVVENVPAKLQLYDRLRPHLGQDTILASNTSTIPIGRLAGKLVNPGRFCGLHFCHPVRNRPLVEIIRGRQTSDQTIATLVAHAKAIGKMPIVVDDGPGFLVNRLLLPYLGEALELLIEGATIDQIERAAVEFGMAKGPLTLLDEIGLDTTLRGGWVLADAFADQIGAAPLLVAMVKAGRLGRKSRAGFFAYRNGPDYTPAARPDKIGPDKDAENIIARVAGKLRKHSTRSIVSRLMLPMVLEATRVIQEGKVRDPRDIDLCVLFGLGFPASRGGLLWWADTLGPARVVEMLRLLGPRCRPTPLLRELARTGEHFYTGRLARV